MSTSERKAKLQDIQPLLSGMLARLRPPPPGTVYPPWQESSDTEDLEREIRSLTDPTLQPLRDLLIRVLETSGAQRQGAILRAQGELARLDVQGDEVAEEAAQVKNPGTGWLPAAAGAIPVVPPVAPLEPARMESLRLSPATRRAYSMWERAIAQCSELEAKRDAEVYDYIKENILDTGEKLPELNTFCRYIRDVRRALGKSKYSPRAGRSGRSIVREEER